MLRRFAIYGILQVSAMLCKNNRSFYLLTTGAVTIHSNIRYHVEDFRLNTVIELSIQQTTATSSVR